MFKGLAKFYVEGIADKCFLAQYLSFLFGVKPAEGDIVICDGWTKLLSEAIVNEMRKNTDNGGMNLVIFDGDKNPAERREELSTIGLKGGCSFEVFLFPDNVKPGALEELLISAMPLDNQPVCDCWHRYESDLARQSIPWKSPSTPTIPAKKTQVYAYLEALLGESRQEKRQIKEAERNYLNQNHWNLTAPGLAPLRDFLKTHLQRQEDI